MIINKVPSYYSDEQLRSYLQRASYPGFQQQSPLPEPTLDTLKTVVLLHLLTYSFENVEMHYSKSHIMNVEPQALFKRFVEDAKGGSYCFGQNGILFGMVRALGYPAYAAAGRVNALHIFDPTAQPQYTSLGHAVVLVEPSDAPVQLVDVGFGGTGLIGPIELKDGATLEGPASEEHRIVQGNPPNASMLDPAGWSLEWRSTNEPWRPLYQFSEAEHYPNDFDTLSFAVCGRPEGGPFWTDVMCMRPFRASDDAIGRMTMVKGAVKRRVNGKSEVVENATTEQERVAALEKHFDIMVAEDDMEFIRGRPAALQYTAVAEA